MTDIKNKTLALYDLEKEMVMQAIGYNFENEMETTEQPYDRLNLGLKGERRINSVVNNINKAFNVFSKLLFIRIDLGYNEYMSSIADLSDIKRDVGTLLNNSRMNRSIFGDMVGYVVKFEYGLSRKIHAHMLFVFDGQKVNADIKRSIKIGEYWRDVITEGRGSFHSCNLSNNEKMYRYDALGKIAHSDDEARSYLVDYLLPYLCKEQQDAKIVADSYHEKMFTQGWMLEPKSNRGRPRKAVLEEISL